MLPGRLGMPGQLSADIGVRADVQQAHQCQAHKGLRMYLIHALWQTLMLRALDDDDSRRDCLHIAVVCLGWYDMDSTMAMPPLHGDCLESYHLLPYTDDMGQGECLSDFSGQTLCKTFSNVTDAAMGTRHWTAMSARGRERVSPSRCG